MQTRLLQTRLLLPAAPLGMAALAALGLAAPAAAQTTLNFNFLTPQAQATGSKLLGTTYRLKGFTLTGPNGLYAISGSGIKGDGETSLYSGGGATTLTQDNGRAFSLSSIDLGALLGNVDSTFFAGPVTFTGTQVGGGKVTVTDTIMDPNGQFQTFTFTGLSNLTSLTFAGSGGNSHPQFDNVVLTPSAAPEPSQLAGLGVTAFGVLGLLLKTRRRKIGVA